MALVWNEAVFGCNDPQVDAQHKELFVRANVLFEATRKGRGLEEIQTIMDFLAAYVVEHFSLEEKRMEERKCPAAKANREAHAAFLVRYQELRKEFLAGENPQATLAILQSELCHWLTDHILKIDSQLRDC